MRFNLFDVLGSWPLFFHLSLFHLLETHPEADSTENTTLVGPLGPVFPLPGSHMSGRAIC